MVKESNISAWMRANAWREILARVFEGFETKLNVFPTWLINPETNRHLKLDLLYPEIGVAVRFEGLQPPKGKPRASLEEEVQQQIRDHARGEVCEQQGIHLITVNLVAEMPHDTFQEIDMVLSRIQRQAKENETQEKISQMRAVATALAHRVRRIDDLKVYADIWDDRRYQATDSLSPNKQPSVSFTAGMEVEHAIFGLGVVVETKPSGNDMLIIIDFLDVGRKTLMASLIADKLLPLSAILILKFTCG